MSTKNTNLIMLGMVAGIVFGVLLGYLVPPFMIAAGFIGRLYLNALMIVVIPMIFAGVVSGVASLGEYRKLGKAGSKTVNYFVVSTGLAAVIALIIGSIFNPGGGVQASGLAAPALMDAPHARTVGDLVATLIPDSLFRALTEGYFVGLVLLSIALGLAISRTTSRGRTIIYFCRELMEGIGKIVQVLQYVAPIGLLSLVGSAVASNRMAASEVSLGLGGYITAAIVAFAIQAVIVIPVLLKMWGKRSALSFGSGMMPALFTAFGTGSSTATLPITYDCTVGRNQVDNRTSSLVLPLGASVNMNGTAIYIVLATLFVSQIFGLSLSIGQMLLLLVTAVVLSFATSGVPSGGFFVLLAAFRVAGFPPSAYIGLTLVLAADWLVERFRAVTNVWSDAVGAAVVAQSIGRGHHDAKATSAPERAPREMRGGRPERSGRTDDRFRSGRPERQSVSTTSSASPFAVTSAETDLESAPSESRAERAESEGGRSGRPPRHEQSDRGGRDRQRFQRPRDGEGGEHGRGGDRPRRSDDRGRREGRHEGRSRFGERGRDRDADRSRGRGPRDDRSFRGGDRSGQEQSRPVPAEGEIPNDLTAAVFGEPAEAVRNEELFSTSSESHESPVQPETEFDFESTHTEHESSSDESDDHPAMEYGRGRSHRAEKHESESEEPSEEIGPVKEDESESDGSGASEAGTQEPLAFGRAPRKKLKH